MRTLELLLLRLLRLKLAWSSLSNIVKVPYPVRTKNKSEYFRDEIVQLFAILKIVKIAALGARTKSAILSTRFYLTADVHRFFAVTSAAPALFVGPAVVTHQSAISDDFFTCTFCHFLSSFADIIRPNRPPHNTFSLLLTVKYAIMNE